MTIKNGDMPAMPTQCSGGDIYGGLTKREMMAMHIASGLISDPQVRTGDVAATAVKVADALLTELERTNG